MEAITKSKVWPAFAVFIIEDDAQNGPDHVDSHRTAGLVISPYVKRGVVDSDMYSTVSMLRTVELLLGLPPMTQHDAAAAPMVNSFMARPDLSGFTALPARIDLMTKNPPQGYGAVASARMDFREYRPHRRGRPQSDPLAQHQGRGRALSGTDAPCSAHASRTAPLSQGRLGGPSPLNHYRRRAPTRVW